MAMLVLMNAKMGFARCHSPKICILNKPEITTYQTKCNLDCIYFERIKPKEQKKKGLKGAYQKGTDKPRSIIVCNISAYVNGRVVFSANNTENLHPQAIDNATLLLRLSATNLLFSD